MALEHQVRTQADLKKVLKGKTTKVFGGKKYQLHSYTRDKNGAELTAAKLRDMGGSARVVTDMELKRYLVYYRMGR